MIREAARAASALLLVLAAATPAAGDWLVLKDGSRVETKGAWEVRGQQVVSHLPKGSLSSLRLADVDLAASEGATSAALAPRPEPVEPVKKAPILVLTQEDLPPVTGAASPPQAVEIAVAAPALPDAAPARVQVTSWERQATDDGTAIAGMIKNESRQQAARLVVTVLLDDAEGKLLATSVAILGGSSLKPGQQTAFRATFPGVFNYERVRFEVDHLALDIAGSETIPAEGARPEVEEPFDTFEEPENR